MDTTILRAIGDINGDLIERAENSGNVRHNKITPWLKWVMPAAACLVVLIIALPYFAKEPTPIIPPDNSGMGSAIDPQDGGPAADAPFQIAFNGDYSILIELIALSEQSEKEINNKINEIEEYFINHPDNGFINLDMSANSERRTDLELIARILREPVYPVIEGTEPVTFGLHYLFGTSHPSYQAADGDHLTDDSWIVSLFYEVNGIEYRFNVTNTQSAKAISQFESNDFWELEFLKSNDDFSVFLKSPYDPELLKEGPLESKLRFGLDIRGLWGDVSVSNADSVQSALDGLFSFEYKSLIPTGQL